MNATSFGDAGLSACAHYYAAQFDRCGGPILPADEAARQKARFERMCEGEMRLPGSGMSAATVEACAAALDASPCELPDGPPEVCNFKGTQPAGAACNANAQCASGECKGTASFSPGGQIGPFTCGTCAPVAKRGEACATGNNPARCESGSVCGVTPGTETTATPEHTCVALSEGAEGEPCDDFGQRCKLGLYCSASTSKCEALRGEGASCAVGGSLPGYAGGCAPPLSCTGLPGAATCTTGKAGAFCLWDSNCVRGLGCVPGPCGGPTARIGCAPSGTCQPITFVGPGDVCDGYARRCRVGGCNVDMAALPADGGVPTGVCPPIVPDGKACTIVGGGRTAWYGPDCDAFSECFDPTGPAGRLGAQGSCTLVDSVRCD